MHTELIDSLLKELRSEQSYILPYHLKKPMIDWSLMNRLYPYQRGFSSYVFVDELTTSEPSASAAPEASPSPSSSPERSSP